MQVKKYTSDFYTLFVSGWIFLWKSRNATN